MEPGTRAEAGALQPGGDLLSICLQAPKGSMPRKKLRKLVLAQVAAKHAVDPALAELKQIFDLKLAASSKFIVAGSTVQLKA